MNIHRLIRSLSSAEKRYFKLWSKKYSSTENTYLKLFDILDNMAMYNPETLQVAFSKISKNKNLSEAKSYLANTLLKCLRDYNEEQIIEWTIRENFYKISLLASKGLDTECEKLMVKTKAEAWQYEQYTILLDILELQLYLFGNCRIGQFDPEYLVSLFSEKANVVAKLSDYNFVLNTWHQINILFQNNQNLKFDEIKLLASKIIQTPELQKDRPSAQGVLTRLRYLACFESYYNFIGDYENSYQYSKLLIDLRKDIEEKQPKTSRDAMAQIFNHMISCYKFQKWNELGHFLELTKNYPIKTIEQEIRKTHNYCYCGMLFSLGTENYELALQIAEVFQSAREKHKEAYRLDFKLFTLAQCGWMHFLTGNYSKANDIYSEIINGGKYAVEIRTQGMVRVFQIIKSIVTQDWDLVEYQIQNTQRFLKSKNLLNENEQIFFKNINKIVSQKLSWGALHKKLNTSEVPLRENSVINLLILHWINKQA